MGGDDWKEKKILGEGRMFDDLGEGRGCNEGKKKVRKGGNGMIRALEGEKHRRRRRACWRGE